MRRVALSAYPSPHRLLRAVPISFLVGGMLASTNLQAAGTQAASAADNGTPTVQCRQLIPAEEVNQLCGKALTFDQSFLAKVIDGHQNNHCGLIFRDPGQLAISIVEKPPQELSQDFDAAMHEANGQASQAEGKDFNRLNGIGDAAFLSETHLTTLGNTLDDLQFKKGAFKVSIRSEGGMGDDSPCSTEAVKQIASKIAERLP